MPETSAGVVGRSQLTLLHSLSFVADLGGADQYLSGGDLVDGQRRTGAGGSGFFVIREVSTAT